MASVFRRSALERISSPEQLDKLCPALRPGASPAAAAAFVMLLALGLWAAFGALPGLVEAQARFVPPSGAAAVCAPADGEVLRIFVGEDVPVAKGMPVAQIKTETGETVDVLSPCAGRVGALCLSQGDRAGAGSVLLRLTPSDSPCAVCFLSPEDAKKIAPGMEAIASCGSETFRGVVLSADTYPADEDTLRALAPDTEPGCALAVVALEGDQAPEVGAELCVRIITGERSPAELMRLGGEG